MFEKSSDGLLLFHPEDGVIDCNEALLRMLGCRDKSDLHGLHPASFAEEFNRTADARSIWLTRWMPSPKEMAAITLIGGVAAGTTVLFSRARSRLSL